MANAAMRAKVELAGTERHEAAGRTSRERVAGQSAGGWGADARRFVRSNPAAVLIGAFILGVALARVARHA
jgi:hypothetical protein